MGDDPILMGVTALSMILIPWISYLIGKKQIKRLFVIPIVCLVLGFLLFFFLVIVVPEKFGIYMFYAAMSLWTGGFFGIFISWYLYYVRKKKL
ncbi:MAG: hypothetical protein JXC31_03880 [Acholeplasmataceae bacterium]|nr:hypothetical protein [Acholeplasmataceae bacterium]